jgi:hypothetical protein
MKVELSEYTPPKPAFVPIKMTLIFETEKEALSFRAVLGGMGCFEYSSAIRQSMNFDDRRVDVETARNIGSFINHKLRAAICERGIQPTTAEASA